MINLMELMNLFKIKTNFIKIIWKKIIKIK